MKNYYIVCLLVFLSQHLYADDGFILMAVLYNETHEARRQEYITCLEKNLNHESIHAIHIIYDTSKDDTNNILLTYIKSKPIQISYVVGRPTYGYCFRILNELYPNSKIILSNADIYFNHTLTLLNNYDLTGKFLALTRWNVTYKGQLQIYRERNGKGKVAEGSQDSWFFKTPIIIPRSETIPLGVFGCDSEIALQATRAQLKVTNPCLSLQCCHLHLTGIRHYPNKHKFGSYEVRCSLLK